MIKVLICDDSLVYRSAIRAALASIPWVEVSGVYSSGRLALDYLKVQPTDLLLLDLEMPEMDGLETLRELNKLNVKTKVILFSATTKRAAETTIEALRLGAVDFVNKPNGSETGDPIQKIRNLLEPKLATLFAQNPTSFEPATPAPSFQSGLWDIFQPKILLIGASTGGPTALEKLFTKLKGPFRIPVVLVQHMPPVFTAALAERLGRIAGVPAFEAKDGMKLENGSLYVAPGDYHLRLQGVVNDVTLRLDQGPQQNSVRPAVDPTFESASEIYRANALAVILTGMGADGKVGCVRLKADKATVLIQDQASSVVWGMPGAVHAVGAYDQVLSLDQIATELAPKLLSITYAKASG